VAQIRKRLFPIVFGTGPDVCLVRWVRSLRKATLIVVISFRPSSRTHSEHYWTYCHKLRWCVYRAFCVIYYLDEQMHILSTIKSVLGKWPTWRTIPYYVFIFIFIFNSLHVSGTSCSSSGEINCVNTTSGNCHSVYCRWPCRVQVGSELPTCADCVTHHPANTPHTNQPK
jgi:hypothetical protein